MTDTFLDTYLAHHGVLGMHWGKHLPGRTEESHNEEYDQAHMLTKKPLHSLSNKDLQTVNQRLQLEQQYSKLTTKKSTLKKGHETVKSIVAVTGTAGAAYGTYKGAVKFLASPEGQKAIDTGAKYIANGARIFGKLAGRV